MLNSGRWWYDLNSTNGISTVPSVNADMISIAFWLVGGSELKITRSDDVNHTALLQSTGGCLGGMSFRQKMASFGDFRGSRRWASNTCLGRCTVEYGGQYKTTQGFRQAGCDGDLQSGNMIGFWCDRNNDDGSVILIGGGGRSCAGGDHGIGITSENYPRFLSGKGYDFGDDSHHSRTTKNYSLNLWIH